MINLKFKDYINKQDIYDEIFGNKKKIESNVFSAFYSNYYGDIKIL